MIEEYQFGSIIIDGKKYNHDIEIRSSNNEVLDWWRNESHLIDIDAVERAISQDPTTIIIGTGASGVANVPEETRKFIESKGIELIVEKTEEATEIFNNLISKEDNANIIGLFHLTC